MGASWFFLVFSQVAFALIKPTAVISMRNSEALTRQRCEQAANCEFISSVTKEFPNGNTFVKLSKEVPGRSVEIFAGDSLSSDELMELLIKVRIAHSNGAQAIEVVFPGFWTDVKIRASEKWKAQLSLPLLLKVAGASAIRGGRNTTILASVNRPRFPWGNKSGEAFLTGQMHPTLRDELAQELNLPVAESGEAGALAFLVAPAVFPVNESFFQILSEVPFLKKKGNQVVLITPYLPYARSDKKDQPGVAITGRLIADLIEAVGTDSIVFARAHAPQSEGFFSIPTIHVNARETLTEFLRTMGVEKVISPDAGFQKDATLIADDLGVPVGVINKQRNLGTGDAKIVGATGLDVAGKVLALPDDETASGSTQASNAELLMTVEKAARVIGVATHLTGKAEKAFQSPHLSMLVVTNSLPISVPESEKFKVLSIAPELAKHLRPLLPFTPVDCLSEITGEGIK